MKEINDFLLNLFTGNNELRQVIMFPNLKNGIVYASDGYVLIVIPEEELSLKYKTDDNYPNAEKVVEDFEKKNLTSVKVKIADIAKELVKARILIDGGSAKCGECDGSGEVVWNYTDKNNRIYHENYNCPECEGSGKIKKTTSFARVRLSMIEDVFGEIRSGISIGRLCFHPFQLYRLFMVALVKGFDSIDIFFEKEKYSQTVTYFGNIKVLVMTMLKDK